MTQQQTGVSTRGFELLLTDGATGVRRQPGVSWRVLLIPTVTHVPVGRGAGRVLCSTLGTGPGMLLLTEVFISDGGHEEDGVSGPLLDTRQVKQGETAGAAPHRLSPLHRADTDQTGQRSGLKQVTDVLTGSHQTGSITTCLVGVGGEGGLQDLSPLPVFVVDLGLFIILLLIRGGGANTALHQSLSSSLVGLPDLLELGTPRRLPLLLGGARPFTWTLLTPATPPALLAPGRLHGNSL